jgi:hypothetical protein
MLRAARNTSRRRKCIPGRQSEPGRILGESVEEHNADASLTLTGISVSSSKIERVAISTRMVAGSVCRENDATSAPDDEMVCTETTKGNLVGIKVDTTTHCADDGLGMLEDLLLHEVAELALHDIDDLNLERFEAASGLGLVASPPRRRWTMDMQFSLLPLRCGHYHRLRDREHVWCVQRSPQHQMQRRTQWAGEGHLLT